MNPKLRTAMDKLETAQGIINEAASDLSAVDGFADEWTELCRLYDTVKEHWYKIDHRRMELQRQSAEEK